MFRVLFLSIISIILFTTNLSALNNPKPFAQIGDTIYNNVIHIEKLQTIQHYKLYTDKIINYVKDVNKAKKIGFLVEQQQEDKLKYLKLLRALVKINDYFIRTIETDFLKALRDEDIALYSITVESNLLDTEKFRREVLNFYKHHKDAIPIQENMMRILDEEQRRKARYSHKKTKKQIAQEKIERIRKNDVKKQKELEQRLGDELKRKKERIRKEQEKELFN